MEQADEHDRRELTDKLTKLLPLLYLKARMLTSIEPSEDAEINSYVTEEDYNIVRLKISGLLGSDDAYMEVFVEDMRYSDTPITCFISEGLTDIYQQLKDMALNYRTELDELMENAVSYCLNDFRYSWGQTLLNILRALHSISFKQEDEE